MNRNSVIGIEKLKASSIIICGIVRNCARHLQQNIMELDKLCDMLKDYHVVIFENDSIDGTKQILTDWKKRRKNIHISLNDFNTITIPSSNAAVNRFFSRSRIEKMATYRNHYLEFIEENQLVADYVLVIDLDVKKINIEGIANSFGLPQDWDAVAANGYIYSPSAKFRKRYNDSYALVECGMEDVAQTEQSIRDNQFKWAFMKRNMPPIRVFSAFGGMAIYKYDAIKDCRYSIFNNNDPRVEVRCEHYSLHKQMQEKGFDRVYINPNMVVKYEPYVFDSIRSYLRSIFKSSN